VLKDTFGKYDIPPAPPPPDPFPGKDPPPPPPPAITRISNVDALEITKFPGEMNA
jgi:hypothetical protein